ncbi:ABC transporter permease [Arthrobacter cupressi]|uniref:NitT/TauT family transport system permease protein n=1 Tax=Arthrobacter cupressi TaxID=1045773 RepID=A0A1G8XT58_9MICC|nr:ABC transporter permease [Arthrobacter cupressi]NYD77039.1 NitT/TauT family transport system permease protein [Arthrobacter cupressi]SDJ93085.1 NitT/TauT family transport system permease protein [Arthrobacter cupressi]
MSATLTKTARALGTDAAEAAAAVGQGTPPPVTAKPATAALASVADAFKGAASRAGSWLWKATGILGFLALWEFGPLHLAPPSTRVFLPPLHEVLQAWGRLFESGSIQGHLAASLSRSVLGFGIAVAAGVSLGLLIAWYGRLNSVLNPLLELFRNTAALALLPVFTLLLGIGEESKVTIVAYAAFFPVLLNTIAGVKTVDPLLIRAAKSLGLNSFRLFQKVILPSAVPTIFTGIRMAGTASILVLIAAEMVGAKAGLGYLIINAQSSFLIPDMYAGILTVSLLGLGVNFLLVALERHFSRWRTAVGA